MKAKGTSTAVIAASGTASTVIDNRGRSIVGIEVPTIDNATVEIQVSIDGTTFRNVKDVAGAIVAQWAASTGGYMLDGDPLARLLMYPFWKIVTGAAQNGGARTFNVVQAC